jgi:CelD/BcsL family acetyltransferase involved in cellulose biosynthesis
MTVQEERVESPVLPTPDLAALSCRVFGDFADLEHMRTAWDDAVLAAHGSVYMTYDWVREWWNFYGQSSELRVFMFSAGGRIVAVVPMYIRNLGWRPVTCRVARLIGANIPPKVFAPPIPAEFAVDVLTYVLAHLFERDRCDVVSLGPASETEPWTQCVRSIRHDVIGACRMSGSVHSVFHLPPDMDTYYAGLSKNERKQRRKYELRLLKKEHDTHVDVVSDPAAVARELDEFAEQHRQQWLAEGKSGHFGAWPRALQFNHALVRAQAKLGRVRFIRIRADGRVIANQYLFAFGDRYYWELPSRVVDPEWERFSLGPTAVVTMIAQGIAEGVTRIEGGLAHYDYKIRLGATEYATRCFQFVRAGRGARVRVAGLGAVRKCVKVAYHKVWYRRIMPWLPARLRRPQAWPWLHLDF